MRIYIRCDGSHSIGLGHIMRMLELARQLKKNACSPVFIARSSSKGSLSRVEKAAYEITYINDDNDLLNLDYRKELACLESAVSRFDRNVLIVDHYGYDINLLRECKKYFSKIILLDDFQPERMIPEIDILVNPNFGAEDLHYPHFAGQVLLLGSRYAMLREEFAASASIKVISAQCSNIGICFGASDTAGMIIPLLQILSGISESLKVSVMVGSEYKRVKELNKIKADYPHELSIHQNVNHTAAWLLEQDLLVISPSTIALEAMVLGIPGALVICEENQRPGSYGLRDKRIATVLGEAASLNTGQARNMIERLIKDDKLRRDYSLRSRLVVDGKGAIRVAERIEQLIT